MSKQFSFSFKSENFCFWIFCWWIIRFICLYNKKTLLFWTTKKSKISYLCERDRMYTTSHYDWPMTTFNYAYCILCQTLYIWQCAIQNFRTHKETRLISGHTFTSAILHIYYLFVCDQMLAFRFPLIHSSCNK